MAIVANKDGLGGAGPGAFTNATDRPYASPNRTNAGTPQSVLTPMYSGEIVQDITNNVFYYAMGTSNTSWVPTALGG